MSNEIYPSLPGLTNNVERQDEWRNALVESDSGRSFSRAMWTYPVRHYRLEYEVLRSGAEAELQQLVGFFNRHKGDFDTWLFDDPLDNTVVNQQFGTGNGTQTAFQLVRSFGGHVAPVFEAYGDITLTINDWQGVTLLSSKPRQNLLLQSETDSNVAPWLKGPNLTRVGKTLAPDGTNTATIYQTSELANAFLIQEGPLAAVSVYVASIYMKLVSGVAPSNGFSISIEHDKDGAGTTVERTSLDFLGLDGDWRRYSLVFTNVAAVANASRYFMGDWGNGAQIAAWGAQLEVTELRCGGSLIYGTRSTTDPLGGDDALKLVERPVNDSHYLDDHGITIEPGQTITYDWYFKAAERSLVRLECYSVPTTSIFAVCLVDVANGIVSDVTAWGGAQMTVNLSDSDNGWKRVRVAFRPGNNETESIIRAALVTGTFGGLASTFYPGIDGAGLYVWMPAAAPKPSRYIATTAAARTLVDYIVNSTGLVSLGEPLAVGASLSWSGKFYHRCRFKSSDITYRQFLHQLFDAKTIEFKTVKP